MRRSIIIGISLVAVILVAVISYFIYRRRNSAAVVAPSASVSDAIYNKTASFTGMAGKIGPCNAKDYVFVTSNNGELVFQSISDHMAKVYVDKSNKTLKCSYNNNDLGTTNLSDIDAEFDQMLLNYPDE